MGLLNDTLKVDENILKILKILKNEEVRFTDLVNAGINRTTLNRKLTALGRAGLVTFTKDFNTGSKAYKLTPLGLKILEKLEEIEKIYEEEMKKAPPKEPEEFLKGEESL